MQTNFTPEQLKDPETAEANRILRTRYGPVAMDRALARGRSRDLTADEISALQEAAAPRAPGSRSTRR